MSDPRKTDGKGARREAAPAPSAKKQRPARVFSALDRLRRHPTIERR